MRLELLDCPIVLIQPRDPGSICRRTSIQFRNRCDTPQGDGAYAQIGHCEKRHFKGQPAHLLGQRLNPVSSGRYSRNTPGPISTRDKICHLKRQPKPQGRFYSSPGSLFNKSFRTLDFPNGRAPVHPLRRVC